MSETLVGLVIRDFLDFNFKHFPLSANVIIVSDVFVKSGSVLSVE